MNSAFHRDAVEHCVHVVVFGRPERQEPHPGLLTDEHAVWDDAVEVHVEIESAPEALHERDGARISRPRVNW